MLKYEAPVTYELILKLCPWYRRKAPPVDVIRAVCGASTDPSFRKPKFLRWLEEYERLGVCCKRGKKLTPERMVYYHHLRQRKLQEYIREKQELLEDMEEFGTAE